MKQRTRKYSGKKLAAGLGQIVLLPAAFGYLELVLHLAVYRSADSGILLSVCFAASFGFAFSALIGLLPEKAARVVKWLLLAVSFLLFLVQLVYYRLFKTYLTLFMLENTGDATEFWKDGLAVLFKNLPVLVIFAAPLIIYGVLSARGFRERRLIPLFTCLSLTLAALFLCIPMAVIDSRDHADGSPYQLLFEEWQTDGGTKEMGIFVNLLQDIRKCVTYDGNEVSDLSGKSLDELVKKDVTDTPEPTREPSSTPTPTPTPIDKSPNALDIPFETLAEKETDSAVKAIHEYMASAETTNKNEYTGLFAGYNVIMLTCEAFSTWAIDEELTPTLYKMANEGFVFENFYNPIWITSTSDGEYAECMGLYPDLQKNNSFKRAGTNGNYLPYCLGNLLKPLGYACYAYHDNTYTYYGRDKSHPLMGYEYKAVGNGLEIKETWPESDLEMMQVSMDDYINEEHFHAYYMTVSGHMRYTWSGNQMAAKHREEVEDLPYSDACKAYIACNMELDQALSYMITRLEEAGKLENTVFVFTGDHYPYGLELDEIRELSKWEIDETFELYRSTLVIWSASMEEPVPVEKLSSSVDILPTVCNLLGLDYDSRLYTGHDIFSDNSPLVIFKDGSWITEYMKYDAKTGEKTLLTDAVLPEDYVSQVKEIVKTRLAISRGILNNNYYKYLKEYLE